MSSPTRPPRYRRSGPWLEAVRLYRSRGYSARDITDFLNDALHLLRGLKQDGIEVLLTAQAEGYGIVVPATASKFQRQQLRDQTLVPAVTALLREAPANVREFWSQGQIAYYIRSLGLTPGMRRNPLREIGTLAGALRAARESHVAYRGWLHLLPEGDDGPMALTPREADVLTALAENGPLTGRQLADVLGRIETLCASREHLLGRLIENRLVVVSDTHKTGRKGQPTRVYSLSQEIRSHERSKQPDGTELRAKRCKNRATD